MQTGLAFWASKTLLSAIELRVFSELASGPRAFDTISGRLCTTAELTAAGAQMVSMVDAVVVAVMGSRAVAVG